MTRRKQRQLDLYIEKLNTARTPRDVVGSALRMGEGRAVTAAEVDRAWADVHRRNEALTGLILFALLLEGQLVLRWSPSRKQYAYVATEFAVAEGRPAAATSDGRLR
jgi:hypothetical protein